MKIVVNAHELRHAVAAVRRAAVGSRLLLIARDSELLIVVLGGRMSCRATVPATAPAMAGVAACELATLDALAALTGEVQLQVVDRDGGAQLHAFQGDSCRLAVPAPQPERTWSFEEVTRAKAPGVGCSRTLARALLLARGFASAKSGERELHVVRLIHPAGQHATIFSTNNTVRFALSAVALDDIASFAVPATLVPALAAFLRRCRVIGVHDGPGNTYLRVPDAPAYLFGWERPRLSPPSASERREPTFAARLAAGDLRQYLLTLRHHLDGGASLAPVELSFGADLLRIRAFDGARPLGFDAAVSLEGGRGGPQTVWSNIETLCRVTDGAADALDVSITNFGPASLLDFAERVAITCDGRIQTPSSAATSSTLATIRRGARVGAARSS